MEVERIEPLIQAGIVRAARHPKLPLTIYNYTAKCQYERTWCDVSRVCRGLILDDDGNIIARPFPKFFNLDEHSASDIAFSKPFSVTEKVDGSMGVLYPSDDGWAIATRGSFTSDQAMRATELYRSRHGGFRPQAGRTYLFEIVYPDNRIVIDYGNSEELILLAVIDNQTGRDVDEATAWTGRVARCFEVDCGPRDVIGALGLVDDGNTEGVVLRFEWPKTGPLTRVKVKLAEYKRIHKLLFMTSEKTIWEALSAGSEVGELAERLPDEFHAWLRVTADGLRAEFERFDVGVRTEFATIRESAGPAADRKAFALAAAGSKNKAFLFKLLDDEPIDDMIWRRLRPENPKPFREQSEAVA